MKTCQHCKTKIETEKPFTVKPTAEGLGDMIFCSYTCFLNMQMEETGIEQYEQVLDFSDLA